MTVSRSGHLVAFTCLRNSVSSASGKPTRNGRMALSSAGIFFFSLTICGRALGVSMNVRDGLFGHPDGVGEEAVVRYRRKVPVADGDPCRSRRIADDRNLEALLQKMTQVGLHAEVRGHAGEDDLRNAALS